MAPKLRHRQTLMEARSRGQSTNYFFRVLMRLNRTRVSLLLQLVRTFGALAKVCELIKCQLVLALVLQLAANTFFTEQLSPQPISKIYRAQTCITAMFQHNNKCSFHFHQICWSHSQKTSVCQLGTFTENLARLHIIKWLPLAFTGK